MSLIASTEPILAGAPAFQDGEQPSLQKTVLVGTVLAVCSGLTCLVTLSSINVNVVQSAYAPVAVPQGTSQTISKAPMKGPARLYNAAARMSLLQPSAVEQFADATRRSTARISEKEAKGPSSAAQLFMGAVALLMGAGAALLHAVRRQKTDRPKLAWNMGASSAENAEYAKQIDEAEQRVRELEARVRQQLDLKEIIGEPAEPVETKQVQARKNFTGMTGTNLGPFEATTVLLIGCSLAAVAGFVNATTLLSVLEQTPSHVTGITTKAAIAYATGDTLSGTESFIALIGLFTSFVLGAFTTGMFAMGETWKLGNRYGFLLLIESAALSLGYGLYYSSYKILTMFVNAFACGLQNALCTRWSGAVIRTTHLTGAATDIGNVLGDWVQRGPRAPDTWRLKFLVPLVVAYFGGGVWSAMLWMKMGYHSIVVPTAWLAFLAFGYMALMLLQKGQLKESSVALQSVSSTKQ